MRDFLFFSIFLESKDYVIVNFAVSVVFVVAAAAVVVFVVVAVVVVSCACFELAPAETLVVVKQHLEPVKEKPPFGLPGSQNNNFQNLLQHCLPGSPNNNFQNFLQHCIASPEQQF